MPTKDAANGEECGAVLDRLMVGNLDSDTVVTNVLGAAIVAAHTEQVITPSVARAFHARAGEYADQSIRTELCKKIARRSRAYIKFETAVGSPNTNISVIGVANAIPKEKIEARIVAADRITRKVVQALAGISELVARGYVENSLKLRADGQIQLVDADGDSQVFSAARVLRAAPRQPRDVAKRAMDLNTTLSTVSVAKLVEVMEERIVWQMGSGFDNNDRKALMRLIAILDGMEESEADG